MNWNQALFPSLHDRKEGWLRHQENFAQPPKLTQPGWFSFCSYRKTTPASRSAEASQSFFDRSATPPCGDARRGIALFQFFHSSIDRRYSRLALIRGSDFGCGFAALCLCDSLSRLEGTIQHDFERRSRLEHQVLAASQENGRSSDRSSTGATDNGAFAAPGDHADQGALGSSLADGPGIICLTGIALDAVFALAVTGSACAAKRGVKGEGHAAGQEEREKGKRQFRLAVDGAGPL